MSWKLWIDDQWDDPDMPFRHPPEGFTAAKTVAEAQALITKNGLPEFIDFDHDLGDGHDAPELIKWMIEQGNVPEYNVHSANPAGKLTIVSLMESWKKYVTLP